MPVRARKEGGFSSVIAADSPVIIARNPCYKIIAERKMKLPMVPPEERRRKEPVQLINRKKIECYPSNLLLWNNGMCLPGLDGKNDKAYIQ